MSSFLKRFKKKKPDRISAATAGASALGAPAAPDVLPRVETPPAPPTPQTLPIVQTPAPPAYSEYQAIVPTQQGQLILGKLKIGDKNILPGLGVVAAGLKECSDICPPLKTTAAVFLTVGKIFDGVSTNQDELKELEARSQAILSLVSRYKEEGALYVFEERVQSFSTAIESLVECIGHLQDRPLPARIAKISNDLGTIQKMLRNLNTVCNLFQIDIQFRTNVSIRNMLQLLNSRSIDKLRPENVSYKTRLSAYGDPTGCMPGTRVNVLERLEAWAPDEQGAKVYWLTGMAGTGKSTIAQSLCELLNRQQMLGASFFCSRTSDETSNPRLIIPGAAYDLAKGSPTFNVEVVKSLEKEPYLVDSNDFGEQFQKLIVEPLRNTVGPGVKLYKIVVIDALDECTNPHLVYRLIRLILNFASSLPLKFFLVSRADPAITAAFKSSQASYGTLVLHNIEEDIVRSDIRLYLKESLAEIKERWNPNKEDRWPPDSELTQLVRGSGKLFIYPSSAVRYIRDGGFNYKGRLTDLVTRAWSAQQTSTIDGLYGHILTRVGDGRRKKELSWMETLLSFVIFLRHPLSINALSALSGISDPLTYLSQFNSVIHIPTEENAPVCFFHPSFVDFIIDPKRCPPNRFPPFTTPLRPASAHADLALKCLELMNGSLRFNMCDTPEKLTVSHMDRRNPPENARKIPEALRYACVYWASHLSEVRDSSQPALVSALRTFLNDHLLHWMECLSVINQLRTGVCSLRSASGALSAIQTADVKDLRSLAGDACRFLQLGFECIEQNCFEVYQSAFTWIPKKSLMRQIYGARAKRMARVTLGLPDSWGPMELCIKENSRVNSVAFSPDGTRVAFGSYDGTVRICNVTTGGLEAKLEGHTDLVTSVAFSPDGTRVAAGSRDWTVRIWDVATGLLEAKLEGHTDSVTSVAFSPDGMRVASGSLDQTVNIWNAMTGLLEAKLEGHTGSVTSVAFSPDGMRVASGSLDQTVNIWNATTGGLEAKLEGRAGSVTSIAFSPDGAQLASGSRDWTVRIWNATTGLLEAKLEGHTDSVTSISFSPGGTRVVSGSGDRTIRIWSATTGGLEAKLEGHTCSVTSVAFSPDGTRVASGSVDQTVRIWNATSGLEAKLEGHRGSVTSVAFSPDGTQVASGSDDQTVEIYNVRTGELEARLEGQMSRVTSLAFSPDGTRVVSGLEDGAVAIWNARTSELEAKFEGHADSVLSVAFSHDSMRVVSGAGDGTVTIWNARTGEQEAKFGGHTHSFTSVAFSPDDMQVVSRSHDGTLRNWSARANQPQLKFEGHTRSVMSVAFSHNDTRFVSGSDDRTVRIWNAGTGQLEGEFEGHKDSVTSVAFSHDGTRVVSGSDDRTVKIRNARTGELEANLEGHTLSVASVAFSHDDTRVVSGSYDGMVKIWNARTGWLEVEFEGHTDSVVSAAFSHDDTRVVSGSDDQTIRIWNVMTGKLEAKLEDDMLSVTSVAFSPIGMRVVSGSDDRMVRIWNAGTGQLEARFGGHTDSVASVAFSPNGTQVVSGSDDRTIRIWNVGTGELETRLGGNTHSMTSVPFLPDDARVVSGSDDWTVEIQNAGTGEWEARFDSHMLSVTSVAFSHDGAQVISGSYDGTVRLWNARTGGSELIFKSRMDSTIPVTFSLGDTEVVSPQLGHVKVQNLTPLHPLPLSFSDDGHWVVDARCHCWIPLPYRNVTSYAFSGNKACFGYASGSVVILDVTSAA